MTGTACRRARLLLLNCAALQALALALLGCSSSSAGDEGGDGGPSDASEAGASCTLICAEASFDGPVQTEVRDILLQVCGNADGCHGGGAANFGVAPPDPFVDIINVTSTEDPPMKRVVPGDPEHSYLYKKLACEGGIVGMCMPLGSAPNPTYIRIFHDWIEAGASTD